MSIKRVRLSQWIKQLLVNSAILNILWYELNWFRADWFPDRSNPLNFWYLWRRHTIHKFNLLRLSIFITIFMCGGWCPLKKEWGEKSERKGRRKKSRQLFFSFFVGLFGPFSLWSDGNGGGRRSRQKIEFSPFSSHSSIGLSRLRGKEEAI